MFVSSQGLGRRWINSSGEELDATRQSNRPRRWARARFGQSRSSRLINDWPSRSCYLKLATRWSLVNKPDFVGQQSAVMTSPASRASWRGFSLHGARNGQRCERVDVYWEWASW